MTTLSVNLNKIALLRNSRGRDYPNVLHYAEKMLNLGVKGITVHPRQDERHITRKDTIDLAAMLAPIDGVELNVEGYPSEDFLQLIEKTQPDQCTLVPDATDQLTSDHGWQVAQSQSILEPALVRIQNAGARAALFLDPDVAQVKAVANSGYDRIELYTEAYAESFGHAEQQRVLERYIQAKDAAVTSGLGVNAGHDLDLKNLAVFLAIGDILEVSIGHALTIESIDQGIEQVVNRYLQICNSAP
ncbi:MAG: pyridoxine 5'-phosphate synthase [Acidiferrobacterales bacterium]|nr:pyridoxine 5'-phosphate synthase [Acidiferrobacterales bacterium]